MHDLKNTSPRVTCRNAVPQNRAEAQVVSPTIKERAKKKVYRKLKISKIKRHGSKIKPNSRSGIPNSPLSNKIANQIGLSKNLKK